MIRVSRAIIIVMQLNKIKLSLLIHKARLTNSFRVKSFCNYPIWWQNQITHSNCHSADIYLQII